MSRYLKYNIPNWSAMQPLAEAETIDIAVLGDTSRLGLVQNEGESLPAPTGLIAVDIIWPDDEPEVFAPFRVWPEPSGHHSFAGMEGLYEQEYNTRDQ